MVSTQNFNFKDTPRKAKFKSPVNDEFIASNNNKTFDTFERDRPFTERNEESNAQTTDIPVEEIFSSMDYSSHLPEETAETRSTPGILDIWLKERQTTAFVDDNRNQYHDETDEKVSGYESSRRNLDRIASIKDVDVDDVPQLKDGRDRKLTDEASNTSMGEIGDEGTKTDRGLVEPNIRPELLEIARLRALSNRNNTRYFRKKGRTGKNSTVTPEKIESTQSGNVSLYKEEDQTLQNSSFENKNGDAPSLTVKSVTMKTSTVANNVVKTENASMLRITTVPKHATDANFVEATIKVGNSGEDIGGNMPNNCVK